MLRKVSRHSYQGRSSIIWTPALKSLSLWLLPAPHQAGTHGGKLLKQVSVGGKVYVGESDPSASQIRNYLQSHRLKSALLLEPRIKLETSEARSTLANAGVPKGVPIAHLRASQHAHTGATGCTCSPRSCHLGSQKILWDFGTTILNLVKSHEIWVPLSWILWKFIRSKMAAPGCAEKKRQWGCCDPSKFGNHWKNRISPFAFCQVFQCYT